MFEIDVVQRKILRAYKLPMFFSLHIGTELLFGADNTGEKDKIGFIVDRYMKYPVELLFSHF